MRFEVEGVLNRNRFRFEWDYSMQYIEGEGRGEERHMTRGDIKGRFIIDVA